VLLLLPAQRNFAHEDSMIRAKNSLYAALFCALATFFLAMPAKGDSVQIATFDKPRLDVQFASKRCRFQTLRP